MKILITAIFILTYIGIAYPVGYSCNSPFYTHFLYMFQHTGILHLLINLFSFLSLFTFLSKVIHPVLLFLYVYLSAVIASFCSAAPLPTVGVSGMTCALIAIYAILPLLGKKLIIRNTKKYLSWLFLTATSLLITSFIPAVNASNHFFALLCGAAFALIDHLTTKHHA